MCQYFTDNTISTYLQSINFECGKISFEDILVYSDLDFEFKIWIDDMVNIWEIPKITYLANNLLWRSYFVSNHFHFKNSNERAFCCGVDCTKMGSLERYIVQTFYIVQI